MLRAFTDSTGTEWRVWDVLPGAATRRFTAAPGSLPSLRETAFGAGWLCFESAAEKRRLAPIPDGWARSADRELERLCARASIVPEQRWRTAGAAGQLRPRS